MRLTRAADYGVRVMLHLGTLSRGIRASRAQLARAAEASPDFVAKILQRLTKAGLVRSRTGRGGGFSLARSVDQVSVLDIISAIDGPMCLNRCLPSIRGCHRSSSCPVHPVWQEAQNSLRVVLGGASLERLLAHGGVRSTSNLATMSVHGEPPTGAAV
jgi:Rrf2 family protein